MVLKYVLQFPTQQRTQSKSFITSVFIVILSGAQTPSTEYESMSTKSSITFGPADLKILLKPKTYCLIILPVWGRIRGLFKLCCRKCHCQMMNFIQDFFISNLFNIFSLKYKIVYIIIVCYKQKVYKLLIHTCKSRAIPIIAT